MKNTTKIIQISQATLDNEPLEHKLTLLQKIKLFFGRNPFTVASIGRGGTGNVADVRNDYSKEELKNYHELMKLANG